MRREIADVEFRRGAGYGSRRARTASSPRPSKTLTTRRAQSSRTGSRPRRSRAIASGANSYGSQKELLDAILEGEGTGIFVASLRVTEHPEADVFSLSTRAADVHTWLPMSDFVMLGRGRGDAAMAAWEDLREIAGRLMTEVPGLRPPRFQVNAFPGEAEMAELRRRTRRV